MSDHNTVDRGFLRAHPLPEIEISAGRDERGTVLIIGASREVPGAILLAAEAALRAGAGKLQIATVESVALHLALAIPEARVIPLEETVDGEIDPCCAARLVKEVGHADAILIGPGMADEAGARALSMALLEMRGKATFVFDAAALTGLRVELDALHGCGREFAITPHPGEMATFLGISKDAVVDDPQAAGREAAAAAGGIVAMKGPDTFICAADGGTWFCRGGGIGMATSGSGDVLAGLIAGFAARGASALLAVQWGVFSHAAAGRRLGKRVGTVGFLARELAGEVPTILDDLSRSARNR
jgi:ADP-dependent NAD(P)H-hydrate dehydratase